MLYVGSAVSGSEGFNGSSVYFGTLGSDRNDNPSPPSDIRQIRSATMRLTKPIIELAAKRYKTTLYAAEALGVAQWSFLRACDREGVEPPGVKRRKKKGNDE